MTETHRAVRDLGARGIQLFSNINGRPLDEPEYLALFAAMAEYDLPVWLHPFRGADMADYRTETRSKFEIWWTLAGRTRSCDGLTGLRRHLRSTPRLKIITRSTSVPWRCIEGRVGPGWDQLGSRTSDEDFSSVLRGLSKRPIDYFRMFYGDTALFGSCDRTVCGLNFFGAGHVLFASTPHSIHRRARCISATIAILDRLPVSEADRERTH